jgi:hypothetical protein
MSFILVFLKFYYCFQKLNLINIMADKIDNDDNKLVN